MDNDISNLDKKISNLNQQHVLVGAQPPTNCSFVRHLVEKMAILKAHLLITIITNQCWRGIFLTTLPFGVVLLDKVIKSPRFSLMTCNQTLGTPMVGHGQVPEK